VDSNNVFHTLTVTYYITSELVAHTSKLVLEIMKISLTLDGDL
jgi:hypothetical protein